jgi:hypothetical protein
MKTKPRKKPAEASGKQRPACHLLLMVSFLAIIITHFFIAGVFKMSGISLAHRLCNASGTAELKSLYRWFEGCKEFIVTLV